MNLLQKVVDWVDGSTWKILGRWEPNTHVAALSLVCSRKKPDEIVRELDRRYAIAARSGLNDAATLHKSLGTFPEGGRRISPGPMTEPEEIHRLLRALEQAL